MRMVPAGFVAAILAVTLACSGPRKQSAAKPPSAPPAAIVAVSGDKQVATIGTPLDQPLVVQVNDAHGAPVTGASVWFRAVNGTEFEPEFGVTGSDGQFTTAVTIGTMEGRYRIVASTAGAGGKTIDIRIGELALGFQENQGRQLSDFYCARCHNSESTPERVSNHDNLVPQPHGFDDGAFLNKISDSDLAAIISHGGPGLGKSAEMPPYGHTVNKADIAALAAYIRAVADPPYQSREVIYALR